MWVRSLSWGQEDHLEEGIITCSSILVWRIPWTEEPGRLQSMESKRVGHNWVSNIQHTEVNGFSLSHLPAFDAILASSESRSIDSVSSWSSQRHQERRPKLPCCPDHGLQFTHCVSCPSENLHHGFPSSATHTEACGPIKFLCFYGSSCSTHFLFPSVFRACFCPGQQWGE